MGFQLKHVQTTANGQRYRRRIPLDVKESLNGQVSFVRPLGSSHDEVLRNYGKAHAEFERLIEIARTKPPAPVVDEPTPTTELALHRELEQRLRAMGYDPNKSSFDPNDPTEGAEFHARSYDADLLSGEFTGYSSDELIEDMPRQDLALVRALLSGVPQQPSPTLEDAKRQYLEDKRYSDPKELKNLQRITAVVGHAQTALMRDPIITTIKRREAKEVMRYMLEELKLSSATVNRYLNDVRAIINHGFLEFDCGLVVSAFKGLKAPESGHSKDSRRPFTNVELVQITSRIEATANDQLNNIWGILAGTGCRMSEVVGLRSSDVFLDVEIPYIRIEGYEGRRLKTDASKRWVPLVGDTFEITKDAYREASGSPILFPRYGDSKSGATSVSAALMKHVRHVTDDKKAAVHSLRHNMKDSLKEVGASKQVQDEILGHTSGGIGENYGGYDSSLKVAAQWLAKIDRNKYN